MRSGGDELSRVLYGGRTSLIVGVGSNLLAALFGVAIGGLAGMARGPMHGITMRLIDVILSFPVLLLAITFLAVATPGVLSIMVIIGLSFGAYLSRLVYTQVVTLREREFVIAAETANVRRHTILRRHIVPHILPSVLVYVTLGIGTAIMLEAALSYVGVGIQPPAASWGNMIEEGQPYLFVAPWLVLAPGLAIMLTMAGFSLLGDGLRDALDPTLERRALLRGVR